MLSEILLIICKFVGVNDYVKVMKDIKKTRVAFFFENSKLCGFDSSNIKDGNSGLSGTAFMFHFMAWLLSVRDNGLDVVFYTTHKENFPCELRNEQVGDWTEAWKRCDEDNTDFLVVKFASEMMHNRKDVMFGAHNTKLIVWCHNFLTNRDLTLYARCCNVARLVAVGREQMDLYRDHRAFLKSDYIYNCVNIPESYLSKKKSLRKHAVVYMGAVIPSKGLHLLAKAWPEVRKAVPDAELFVIGNGNLYSRDKKTAGLGTLGLAEDSYEKMFSKYITDDNGLLPGVHLLGLLGNEKYDVLAEMKVGVPNPSGRTETFCICAVEMQMMGARIVSKRCVGYLDTVYDGVLFDNPKELAGCIISELLAEKEVGDENEYRDVEKLFMPDAVAMEWERLLLYCIPNGCHLHDDTILCNPNFELKRFKEVMRQIKSRYPVLYNIIPTIGLFIEMVKRVRFFIWKRKVKYFGF